MNSKKAAWAPVAIGVAATSALLSIEVAAAPARLIPAPSEVARVIEKPAELKETAVVQGIATFAEHARRQVLDARRNFVNAQNRSY